MELAGVVVTGGWLELDQRELELDALGAGKVGDLEHLDQPLELGEDLSQVAVVTVQGDRHARAPRLVRGADRQRLDVEAPSPQQPRDAVQGARSVDDQGAHHVASLLRVGLAGRDGRGARGRRDHSAAPSTMSLRPLPGSIIG